MKQQAETNVTEKTQRAYARLAGFLYIGVLVFAFGGGFLASQVAGTGTLAETSLRIASSEWLYRGALSLVVIATLGSAVLSFALYATLRPVDGLLAQLGMIFCLSDAVLGLVVRMTAFVRMQIYTSVDNSANVAQALLDLMRNVGGTTENIGGIAFGVGSLLFFYLFLKSRYIPRPFSALGFAASVIWTATP